MAGDNQNQSGGFNWQSLIPLGALAPMLYQMFQGPQNNYQNTLSQVPGLQQMIGQSITQQNQVAPLRGAAMNTAAGMLPDRAWQGYNAFNPVYQASAQQMQPAQQGGSQQSGGGSGLLSTMMALLAGGGGFALGRSGAGNSIVDLLKKITGGNSNQGSKGGGAGSGGAGSGGQGGNQGPGGRTGKGPSGNNTPYDPWSDPANYDKNGQYIGEGAYNDQGTYVGGGDDPYAGGGGNGGGNYEGDTGGDY